MKKISTASIAGMLWVLLVLAGTLPVDAAGETARGELKDKDGKSMGTVTMTQDNAGAVRVAVQFSGVPAGVHGIHVHAVGKCEGPDFMSAGGHFNPTNKKHGLDSPEGAHGGDLPNLTAPASGSGTYDNTTRAVTLSAGATSIFDADGATLVIHAQPDDNKTDPSGNSGGRIACAVLTLAQPGQGGAPPAAPRSGLGDQTPPASLPTGLLLIGLLLVLTGAAGGYALVRRNR